MVEVNIQEKSPNSSHSSKTRRVQQTAKLRKLQSLTLHAPVVLLLPETRNVSEIGPINLAIHLKPISGNLLFLNEARTSEIKIAHANRPLANHPEDY